MEELLLLELEVVEDALLLVPRLIAVTVKTPLLIVCVTAGVVLFIAVVALVLVAVGDCGDSMCSGVRLPSEPSLESEEGGVNELTLCSNTKSELVKAAILAIVKLKVPFALFLICPSVISGVGEQLEAGDRGSFLMQDSSISISEQMSDDIEFAVLVNVEVALQAVALIMLCRLNPANALLVGKELVVSDELVEMFKYLGSMVAPVRPLILLVTVFKEMAG
uniref:Uncharacterized protein n=1 Tax=Glossina pallidipes TaxID=7398 RepID=A0A1B0A693_GLOPL